jgi:hypothetical protein
MLPRTLTVPVSDFLLERFLNLLPVPLSIPRTIEIVKGGWEDMADAVAKIEQARRLIEEAKGIVEESGVRDKVCLM